MKVKPTPHWDPESAPTFWINQASRSILRHFEQALRPLGFGMAYLPVAGALEKRGPLQQKELAELARVEQPTMAALLARMDRDGLLTREPHPTDKRASLVSLSAKAKAATPAARKRLEVEAERALFGLDERERATLIALLRRVVENLEESTDED